MLKQPPSIDEENAGAGELDEEDIVAAEAQAEEMAEAMDMAGEGSEVSSSESGANDLTDESDDTSESSEEEAVEAMNAAPAEAGKMSESEVMKLLEKAYEKMSDDRDRLDRFLSMLRKHAGRQYGSRPKNCQEIKGD